MLAKERAERDRERFRTLPEGRPGNGPGTTDNSGARDREMISVFHMRKPRGDRSGHLSLYQKQAQVGGARAW